MENRTFHIFLDKMKGFLIVFIALVSVSFSQASEVNYGLYFRSYSDLGKDRTSLILNNGNALEIKDETTLSFDMYIRKELEFGYILHIISGSVNKTTKKDTKIQRTHDLLLDGPVENK